MPSPRTLCRRRAAGLPADAILSRGRRRQVWGTEIGQAVADSGLSTSEVARRLGWSRTRLQEWVRGRNRPPAGAVDAVRSLACPLPADTP